MALSSNRRNEPREHDERSGGCQLYAFPLEILHQGPMGSELFHPPMREQSI